MKIIKPSWTIINEPGWKQLTKTIELGKYIGEFRGQKDYANGIIKIHQVTNQYHKVTWERIPNQ